MSIAAEHTPATIHQAIAWMSRVRSRVDLQQRSGGAPRLPAISMWRRGKPLIRLRDAGRVRAIGMSNFLKRGAWAALPLMA